MKRSVLFKSLACLFIALVISKPKAFAQNSKSMTEVTTAVEHLRKAMVDADGATLDKLTSSELSYGHSSGKLQTKKEFVDDIVTGVSDFVSIDLTEQNIKIVGNTAIVRHVLSAATNDKGKGAGTVKLGILLVWVKNNSEWQLVARQAVKVP
ncbi:nuclear transport factor 2 family protein [Mucilaginibacter sabulilitoris]|uniref:Nuclear transport factor 2 family protein n=1 Tax=Mucilaginibacter sabulilitoris TaxID=1173583 RepID=A0ABZ0TNC1_9SPHI|nr:nuclear transport factor 2 family protein [Mucilaginibacter sabulilitoris]WPU92665.1 nuclear transport factor 2 family protein [Mucilaginibacter sabulilitoris]